MGRPCGSSLCYFQELSDEDVTPSKIVDLAEKYEFLSGKWIMFLPCMLASEVWRIAVSRLHHGIMKNVTCITIDKIDEKVDSEAFTKISFWTDSFRNELLNIQVNQNISPWPT